MTRKARDKKPSFRLTGARHGIVAIGEGQMYDKCQSATMSFGYFRTTSGLPEKGSKATEPTQNPPPGFDKK